MTDHHTHAHDHTHDHDHIHPHDHEHNHDHAHGHSHGHTHDPAEVKSIVNRLSRAIGHLESVKNMVAEGRDCSEVLVQLSAVRSAINNTGILILQSHINHCIIDAVQEGDMNAVVDLNNASMREFK